MTAAFEAAAMQNGTGIRARHDDTLALLPPALDAIPLLPRFRHPPMPRFVILFTRHAL